MDAVDRIIGGLEKKNKIITPKEKRTIAYHEAGHASVSWLLEHANPLVKVTIVPRGQALGAAWYLPEERQITTKAQLLDQMISLLGGRAAEEIVFGEVSTGALNDLERVTKQAYAMVVYYGLDKEIGIAARPDVNDASTIEPVISAAGTSIPTFLRFWNTFIPSIAAGVFRYDDVKSVPDSPNRRFPYPEAKIIA